MTFSDPVTTEADGHFNNQESSGSHWERWDKKQDSHPLLSLYRLEGQLPHPVLKQGTLPSSHKARKSRPMFILRSATPYPPILECGHLPRVAVLQAHSRSEESQTDGCNSPSMLTPP